MPSATEKRRQLSEMAGACNVHLDWVDGVKPEDVDANTLPAHLSDLRGYSLGAYKAHMNALDRIIEDNLATAVIAEDDIDWDVRIKSQLRSAAHAFRVVAQSTDTFEVIDYDGMPALPPPRVSPYGDDWEVLWLGLCRQNVDPKYTMVVRQYDSTVPELRHVQLEDSHDQPWNFLHNYPNHTRIYHQMREGLCSLFYAVTLEAAKKIRHEFGDVQANGPLDVMLLQYCNPGGRPGIGDKVQLRCYSAMPQLINHWHPEERRTKNIRWSARANVDKLKASSEIWKEDVDNAEFIDSYPDSSGAIEARMIHSL